MELGTSLTLTWSPLISLNAYAGLGCKGRVCYVLCSKKDDIIHTGVWALLSA